MIPFGKEKDEASKKPLRFLELRTHDPAPKTRIASSSKAFQSEPAESSEMVTPKVTPKATGLLAPKGPQKRKAAPFQTELEEVGDGRQRMASATKPASRPFQEEMDEEEDETSEEGEEELLPPTKTSVFSLGWQSAQTFVAGSFWKENADEKETNKKRAYNNENRKATAEYKRDRNRGCFQANGVGSSRLEKLFALPTCACRFSLL